MQLHVEEPQKQQVRSGCLSPALTAFMNRRGSVLGSKLGGKVVGESGQGVSCNDSHMLWEDCK